MDRHPRPSAHFNVCRIDEGACPYWSSFICRFGISLLYRLKSYNSVSFSFSAFSATVRASIISWISPFMKPWRS